ncbi:MAG: MotA/TolQ/ExbB proton channel family protein [Burkholderiaceae bacterium]|jgi:biopolymer transport protein ExbB|nr:MotA/TolQ/ExbB proton channel family protein [Burkholderiaceae bacterium]
MNFVHWWRSVDAVTQTAALVLLLMSVASWVILLWKTRLLSRASADLARSLAAFWQAPDWPQAHAAVAAFDRESLVLPLVVAADMARARPGIRTGGSALQEPALAHATRLLRGALNAGTARLQYGQVVLATVGATAPFVGLLGTVWGIYHALAAMAGAGQISVERLAGPVGEALIMTAAGLAVAIPSVLGYNVLGRSVARLEGELEGFAHDLRELCASAPEA